MKYKTLVRLALQLFGVVLLVLGLLDVPTLLSNYFQYASMMGTIGPSGTSSLWWSLGTWGSRSVIKIAVGFYLFRTGAPFIVNRLIPSNRPYCHECGYELTRAAGPLCPECGTAIPPAPSPSSPAS